MLSLVSFMLQNLQQRRLLLRPLNARPLERQSTSSVANMSLGGGQSQALNDAVNGAVDSGLHFAVAAGSDNRDARSFSPAGAEKAITVGASTVGDERIYFSNYGRCVNIFGPGLNILSTWIGSDSANNTIPGTSLAPSHVAGLLAYLLSIYPHATFDPRMSSLVSAEHNAQRPFTGSVTTLYESICTT